MTLLSLVDELNGSEAATCAGGVDSRLRLGVRGWEGSCLDVMEEGMSPKMSSSVSPSSRVATSWAFLDATVEALGRGTDAGSGTRVDELVSLPVENEPAEAGRLVVGVAMRKIIACTDA